MLLFGVSFVLHFVKNKLFDLLRLDYFLKNLEQHRLTAFILQSITIHALTDCYYYYHYHYYHYYYYYYHNHHQNIIVHNDIIGSSIWLCNSRYYFSHYSLAFHKHYFLHRSHCSYNYITIPGLSGSNR